MSYSLVVVLLMTGQMYVERSGLSLNTCADYAAMARQEFLKDEKKLTERIGEVRFFCKPEPMTPASTK